MLSIANEVDLLIFCCVYFVCNTNHVFSNTNSILDAHKKTHKGKKIVGCKWILKIKWDVSRKVERFKARLMVKGYTQDEN